MSGVLDNVKVGDRLFVSNGLIKGIEVVERLTQRFKRIMLRWAFGLKYEPFK